MFVLLFQVFSYQLIDVTYRLKFLYLMEISPIWAIGVSLIVMRGCLRIVSELGSNQIMTTGANVSLALSVSLT